VVLDQHGLPTKIPKLPRWAGTNLDYRSEIDRSPDGNSHVVRGNVSESKLVEAQTILFKETPAHSSYDWHNDPIPQYVITLAGVLEFTTVDGETFTIHPGDVLVAEDHIGSGHKWRLINDDLWKRAYVVFKKGVDTQFVPDPA
jgi:quercetin dioxygenase-like cupin family protein